MRKRILGMIVAASAAGVTAMGGAARAATITHQYTFNDGTANDSVGGANGTLENGATIVNGQAILSGGTAGSGGYVSLPDGTIGINTYTAASFETWFSTSATPAVNAQMFTFGGTNTNGTGYGYLIFNPNNGNKTTPVSRVALSKAPVGTPGYTAEQSVSASGLIVPTNGSEHLYTVTVAAPTTNGATINLYLDGNPVASGTLGAGYDLSKLSNQFAYIGKSPYTGDPTIQGSVDQFSIWNGALTPTQVSNDYKAGPVPVPEPDTLGIAALGIAGLLLKRRRRVA